MKLNAQLSDMERELFGLKQLDPELPLTVLHVIRTVPRENVAAWGVPPDLQPPPAPPASGAAEGPAAGAANQDESGGGFGGGGGAKKKSSRKKKPFTLAQQMAFTDTEWREWYAVSAPRLDWDQQMEYKVLCETANGLAEYPAHAQRELLASYFKHETYTEVCIRVPDDPATERTYVIVWIGGDQGLQYNKLVTTAAVRKVVITSKRRAAPQNMEVDSQWPEMHWQQGAASSSGWDGWQNRGVWRREED
jgi:hypothetical protein